MDSALNENEAELGVGILAVAVERTSSFSLLFEKKDQDCRHAPLKVLSDGNSLLDEGIEVLGEGRSETVHLEDTEDLVAGDAADLGDTVGVTEDDTDLGGSHTLTGELEDVL